MSEPSLPGAAAAPTELFENSPGVNVVSSSMKNRDGGGAVRTVEKKGIIHKRFLRVQCVYFTNNLLSFDWI